MRGLLIVLAGLACALAIVLIVGAFAFAIFWHAPRGVDPNRPTTVEDSIVKEGENKNDGQVRLTWKPLPLDNDGKAFLQERLEIDPPGMNSAILHSWGQSRVYRTKLVKGRRYNLHLRAVDVAQHWSPRTYIFQGDTLIAESPGNTWRRPAFFSFVANHDGDAVMHLSASMLPDWPGPSPYELRFAPAAEAPAPRRLDPDATGDFSTREALEIGDPFDPKTRTAERHDAPKPGVFREYLVRLDQAHKYRASVSIAETDPLGFLPIVGFYNKHEILDQSRYSGARNRHATLELRPTEMADYRIRVTSGDGGMGEYAFSLMRERQR